MPPFARPDTERPEWNGLLPRTLFARLERRPVIGAGVCALGDGLRASMDDRALELIALRVSARRDCLYVWRGHCRIAHLHIHETLTLTEIARVATGSDALTGGDSAIVRAVEDLLDRRQLTDATRAALGDNAQEVVIATLFYDLITTFMADAEPEEDAAPIIGVETPAAAVRWLKRTRRRAPTPLARRVLALGQFGRWMLRESSSAVILHRR